MVTKAGRIRKPVEASRIVARRDRNAEPDDATPDRQVPVPGLVLPERAADESNIRVGSVNDPAEAEAEATARSIVEVLRTVNPIADPVPAGSANQAHSASDAVRRTAVVGAEGGELDAGTAGEISQLRGTGRPLPAPVRHGMEAAFGADLSDVRVHTGGAASQLNEALQSRAFTAGRDIAFADGMPDTTTADGQHLLAHELTHVLQNRGSDPIRRTFHRNGAKKATTLAELQKSATIKKAPDAVQYVLRYWDTSTKEIDYSTLKDLVDKAKKKAPKMDAAFAKSLLSIEEIDSFESRLQRWGSTPTSALEQALTDRRGDLTSGWGKQLGANYSLPSYVTPTHYSTPKALLTSEARSTGREDGEWVTTTNPIPGAGGVTTGSVNAELLLEAQSQGALVKVGDGYQQICETCGRFSNASQFEVDHQQAFSEIRDNIIKLAGAMTTNVTLYNSVKSKSSSFAKLFQVTGKPGKSGFLVTPLGSAVHLYSNDMTNLMRICRHCNGPWGKSDMDMVSWFLKSPYFGQEFLNAYQLITPQKQVIARTKQGLGWGEAARDWFATHHLPVLKELEVLAQLQELGRQRLTEQSTTGVKAHVEVQPSKKQKLTHDIEQQARDNEAFFGTLRLEMDYQTGTLLGQKPYPMAPGSPRQMELKTKEIKENRHKRKRAELLTKRKSYQVGEQDGQLGADRNRPAKNADPEDIEAYQLGYDAGQQEYAKSAQQGMADALTADLNFDLSSLLAAAPSYATAFQQTLQKRQEAWRTGLAAGTAGVLPDFGYALGQPNSEVLLRDYGNGYNHGMLSKQQLVTSNMTS